MTRNSLKYFIFRSIVSLYLLVQILVLSLAMELMAQPDRAATDHPNPLPLANLRSEHPRVWFNKDNISLLRQRWNDPVYSEIVSKYVGGSNSPSYIDDALALALRSLATDNSADCRNAIAEGRRLLDSGDALLGDHDSGYAYIPALIFDWCYNEFTNQEREYWLTKLLQRLDAQEREMLSTFYWHETFNEITSYMSTVLAIEGEAGVPSRLREAQNVLQNWQEMSDEVSGDGGYRTYFYQGQLQMFATFMFTEATDLDMISRNGYMRNYTQWIVHRLGHHGRQFTRGPADDPSDGSGHVTLTWNQGACGFFMLADHFNDPLAQWIGNTLVSNGQSSHWEDNEQAAYPSWLSLIYYSPSNNSLSPYQLNTSLVKYFDKIGMVAMRSGWHFNPESEKDIIAWFYNGPKVGHMGAAQNHFTIWRGDDDLIITGGNYFGASSTYYGHYGNEGIARNTLIFSPVGSSSPDRDGGQFNSHWIGDYYGDYDNREQYPYHRLLQLSVQKLPIFSELSWTSDAIYRGEITHFVDQSEYAITTGDATIAYDPKHVTNYLRDFVYIKPDIFLIRDRFITTNVENVRFILHSRTKPNFSGSVNVIRGSQNAGILEAEGSDFFIEKGESQVDIKLLWPRQASLKFIGGAAYEAWVDGSNSDPARDAQSTFLNDPEELGKRMSLSDNQWRTEIAVTPQEADGNIITAFFVSPKQTNLVRPSFTLTENGNTKRVVVAYKNKSLEIIFPPDNVPALQGVANDNQPPMSFALEQNYPNPFNPETVIKYQLPEGGLVDITIFNLLGQKIKTLVKRFVAAGSYEVRWTGKNDLGHQVTGGIYFYRLRSGDFVEIKKMILLQ